MSDSKTARFYCVKWETEEWGTVIITFGVSLVLLSLTHDMRWWGERENDCVYGANRDFIVLERGWLLCLQDRATGQASLLLDGGKEWDQTSSNGKWLLLCDNTNQRMAVVEIPRKSTPVGGTTAIKKPVVVQIGGGWNSHLPQFTDINEDCVLLDCQQVDDQNQNFCGIILVDLAQTCASGKLAVLSSTSDAYYFVVGNGGNGDDSDDDFTPSSCYITIEGATGKSHPTFQGDSRYLRVLPLNQSQFCTFDPCSDQYEVWDVSDTTKPFSTQKMPMGGSTLDDHAFFEGGLLFQMSASSKEMHVTEESSGSHVITFNLFRPLVDVTHHCSFPLSSAN
ncbi:hypothetical protein Pelo_6835 [Pelomyxa schiedti]|nr:hypothetical protein Pelo_6835 [Pelomyxa schiedti]